MYSHICDFLSLPIIYWLLIPGQTRMYTLCTMKLEPGFSKFNDVAFLFYGDGRGLTLHSSQNNFQYFNSLNITA